MLVCFDRFSFDSEKRLLLEAGAPIHLSPKAFSLLAALLEAAPRALCKEEIHSAVWPDTFVEESSLPGLISELRTAFGDRSKESRFIRTVHGFGYAFSGTIAGVPARLPVGLIVSRGREFSLYAGENILGRDAGVEVQVDDHTVSRRHARIVIEGDQAFLEDMASKNGTLLGEDAVEGKVQLHDGQTIVLGDARLLFRRGKSLGTTITRSGS